MESPLNAGCFMGISFEEWEIFSCLITGGFLGNPSSANDLQIISRMMYFPCFSVHPLEEFHSVSFVLLVCSVKEHFWRQQTAVLVDSECVVGV